MKRAVFILLAVAAALVLGGQRVRASFVRGNVLCGSRDHRRGNADAVHVP